MKKYSYDGTDLYVGLKITDANGFNWNIIECGPKKLKATLIEHPEVTIHPYHECFVNLTINRGTDTNRFKTA